jgi:uncharacterized protein YndB with AHSA1/START domain
MATISYTLADTVPAPMAEVFELLTNPAHIPQWLPGCKSVEPHGPLHRGSRLRLSFGRRTAELEVVELEIVELTPHANFGWIERRGRPGSQIYFHLGFAGGSTTLTMKSIWHPKGLRAWLRARWSRRKDAQRMFEGLINNLRRMVTSH